MRGLVPDRLWRAVGLHQKQTRTHSPSTRTPHTQHRQNNTLCNSQEREESTQHRISRTSAKSTRTFPAAIELQVFLVQIVNEGAALVTALLSLRHKAGSGNSAVTTHGALAASHDDEGISTVRVR